MSPVHVIVGDDPRAETMWAGAFTGAVDLYRFNRNVDAFERLTAAEAPVDLVVLTPAQGGPFNLTADQFIARVLEGPLGASRYLANLHVIVVGQPVMKSHPRVMAVSTLDAAIRLVKFGEVEHGPRPEAPRLPEADAAPNARSSRADVASLLEDLPFSGSVISRIWDAPDPEPSRAAAPVRDARDARDDDVRPATEIAGGGPVPTVQPAVAAEAPAEPAPAQLFARPAATGFMVTPAEAAAQQPGQPAAMPVVGGGEVAVVGTPSESIEVATGALQPARPYQLEQAGYRGPAVRGGVVHGAAHDGGGQPVPPALASQVHSMVYGGMHVGNPNDPLLTWSSGLREQAASVPGEAPGVAPQPPMAMQPAEPVAMQPPMPVAGVVSQSVHVAVPAAMAQAPRVVPMDPPVGAYGSAPAPVPADPFLARAEQGGGDVAFG